MRRSSMSRHPRSRGPAESANAVNGGLHETSRYGGVHIATIRTMDFARGTRGVARSREELPLVPPLGPKRIPSFIAPFKGEPGSRVRLPKDFAPTGSREVNVG